MKRLQLKRVAKKETYTIGKLYVDGKYFCDTIEDKVRDLPKEAKIAGKTAIPAGTYQIIVNQSPRFKRLLPRLLAVPYFDGVLIHRGNTAEDSSGCIILGENKVVGKVINSTGYELRLVGLLRGEKNIIIEII
ncbi:MAG: DUF5675 family protein [Bacteroidaceae bacterium]